MTTAFFTSKHELQTANLTAGLGHVTSWRSRFAGNAENLDLNLSINREFTQRRQPICNDGVQIQMEIQKISRGRPRTLRRRRRIWSFHVVVLQRTAKKCTEI